MSHTDPLLQLENDSTLNKYKTAGIVASKVLARLVNMAKPGIKLYDMCIFGDKAIIEELTDSYKTTNRGIAFPTCVSVNNMAGNYSPSSTDTTEIEDGDLVKIDFGVHIDGFPALIAYTVLVNESGSEVEDKKARLLNAVNMASKEVIKNMKVGKTNMDIVNIIQKCAIKYGCSIPVGSIETNAPGIISSQISRNILCRLDGEDDIDDNVHRFILHRDHEDYGFSMCKLDLDENEVYAIDITMTSGTGKLTPTCSPTDGMIYRRNDNRANLKLRRSRDTLNQFSKNNLIFPVNIRDVLDTKFKFGIKECVNNKLLDTYLPCAEKKGEYVVRSKFTVIVRKKPILIAARSLDEQVAKL